MTSVLPDFLSDSNQWKITNGYNISDPTEAAEVLLGIAPAVSQVEGSNQDAAPYNDIRKVTFTFKDNSKVVVTMINQFGQGLAAAGLDGRQRRSFPHGGGSRAAVRTRRAAQERTVYLPDLDAGRSERPYRAADGYDRRRAMDGKYGPSSPSATDFVLVPTDDESSYCVVFPSVWQRRE